jgi:predicted nucleic acid-binding protein
MKRILDAWPVMKWIQGEQPFAQRTQTLLDDAADGKLQLGMNLVNVGEVFYSVANRTSLAMGEQFLREVFPDLPVQPVLPDADLIFEAARWKTKSRISYADAFALATAERWGTLLVTGDPEMRHLGEHVIDWMGG